jgi:gas vesicle protein
MTENNKFISGLLMGVLAGSALALYLNSDKGKQLLTDLNIETAGIKDGLESSLDKAEESLQDMLAKAKQLVADLEQKMGEA